MIPVGLIILLLIIAAIEVSAIRFVYRRTGSGLTACAVGGIVAVVIMVVVVGGDDSSVFGRFMSSPLAEKVAKQYTKESSVLTTVFADHPKEKDRFIAAAVTAYRTDGSESALEAMAQAEQALANRYFTEYFGRTNPDNAVGYAKILLSVTRNIAQSSPRHCYIFLFHDGEYPPSMDFHFSRSDRVRLWQHTQVFFMLARANRHLAAEPKFRPENLDEVFREVRAGIGEDNFFLPSKDLLPSNRGAACRTMIAIMTNILRRPVQEAGPLIKTLLLHNAAQRGT